MFLYSYVHVHVVLLSIAICHLTFTGSSLTSLKVNTTLRMIPTVHVILNGWIKFSYFYLEDALTCCLFTEQIKKGVIRLNFDLYRLKELVLLTGIW